MDEPKVLPRYLKGENIRLADRCSNCNHGFFYPAYKQGRINQDPKLFGYSEEDVVKGVGVSTPSDTWYPVCPKCGEGLV